MKTTHDIRCEVSPYTSKNENYTFMKLYYESEYKNTLVEYTVEINPKNRHSNLAFELSPWQYFTKEFMVDGISLEKTTSLVNVLTKKFQSVKEFLGKLCRTNDAYGATSRLVIEYDHELQTIQVFLDSIACTFRHPKNIETLV